MLSQRAAHTENHTALSVLSLSRNGGKSRTFGGDSSTEFPELSTKRAWVVVPQDSGNLLTSWASVLSHIITELSCGGKSLSPPRYTATGEMPEVQTFYTGAWTALLPLTFLISLSPSPLPIILRTDRTLSLKLSLPPRAGTNTLLLLGPTQWPAERQDLRAHPELCHQQGLL